MKLLLAAIVALAFSVAAMAEDPAPPANPPPAGGAMDAGGDAKPAPAKADKKGKKKHGKKKAKDS